jgi:copper(I)-binding protein
MSNEQPLQKGQQVKIKAEFQDAGDDKVETVVLEDRGDRVLVEHRVGLAINPTECIQKSMLSL